MLKSLLVALKPAPRQEYVAEFAAEFAAQRQLQLDACTVVDRAQLAPPEPVPLGGGAFKAERDEQRLAEGRTRAAQVAAAAEAAARQRGLAANAWVREGDASTVLGEAVQVCDLLVCGHHRGSDASERSCLHAILKHCPRPAIVVPEAEFPRRAAVLVAYDGSAQAARALAAFASLGLADGARVVVAALAENPAQAELHGHTARAFLQRHGFASELRTGPFVQGPAPDILATAEQVEAGLIVMGAFGRSAVREFFLGSVTRSVLAALPVPVLLDH